MTAPARFKQEDVKRAVAGALGAGLRVGRVEITPDGRIVVHTDSEAAPSAAEPGNPWDRELKR